MKSIFFSLVGLMIVFVIKTEAQILEECYWECGVDYCSYVDDYCDYVCHEVCYPIIKRKLPLSVEPRQNLTESGPKINDNLVSRNQALLENLAKEEAGRIGKTVKMRLENPAYETLRRGKYVLTRGSPPRGFAIFQDCLSNDNKANNKPVTPNA